MLGEKRERKEKVEQKDSKVAVFSDSRLSFFFSDQQFLRLARAGQVRVVSR